METSTWPSNRDNPMPWRNISYTGVLLTIAVSASTIKSGLDPSGVWVWKDDGSSSGEGSCTSKSSSNIAILLRAFQVSIMKYWWSNITYGRPISAAICRSRLYAAYQMRLRNSISWCGICHCLEVRCSPRPCALTKRIRSKRSWIMTGNLTYHTNCLDSSNTVMRSCYPTN